MKVNFLDIDGILNKCETVEHRRRLIGIDAIIPAWNCGMPDEPLMREFLTKAGLALLIKDIKTGEAPDLEAVVRSKLVAQSVQPAGEVADPTPGAPPGTAVPPVEVGGRAI